MHESTKTDKGTQSKTMIIISKYFDVSIDYLLDNKVTVPEHYIIVNEAFPGCIEYLYTFAWNLNIQQREKLINLIKLIIDLQKIKGK